jgi:hypothetical protein
MAASGALLVTLAMVRQMAKRKKYDGICIYCGNPQEDVDHIPPRSLIPPKSRANIIQVPACKNCNSKVYSRDDEYMMVWSTLEDAATSIDAREVSVKVARWKDKPGKAKQLDDYFAYRKGVILKDRMGRETKRLTFRMKNHRVVRFCERIITALYYHVFKNRLPEGYFAKAIPEEDSKTDRIRAYFQQQFDDEPFSVVGVDTLRYRFVGVPDRPGITIWHLIFYRRIYMYGVTTHKTANNQIALPGVADRRAFNVFG